MQSGMPNVFEVERMTETAKEILDLWWLWLVRGALAILFGVAAWAWPGLTLVTLIWILGAYIILDGVVSVIGSMRHGELSWGRRILLLLWGVVQIIGGIVLWVAPGLGAVTLMVIFGVWTMLTGMFLLVSAFTSDGHLMSPWMQGLVGLLGVLVGIYLVVEPGRGALATTWAIGSIAIVYGIFLILVAFKIRGLRNKIDDRATAAENTVTMRKAH
ncbi:MAG: DUF308 domain-containing protein [Thermomicrobiales bacterium]|nr:DUF308 domain-containing protein [Thermomicrobiales bacterium]